MLLLATILHIAFTLLRRVGGAARGPRFAGAERARVQKVSITLLHNLCNCVIAERSFYANKFRKRW